MLELNRVFSVSDIPVLRAEIMDYDKRLAEIQNLPASIRLMKEEEVKWLGERITNITRIINKLRKSIKAPIAA